MSEVLRGVSVHIEVDTNKDTYPLHLDDVDLATAEREIAEFLGHMEDL
jgi:hypothetical protein